MILQPEAASPAGARTQTADELNALAQQIRTRSLERWGTRGATVFVGSHPRLVETLEKVVRFAASDSPVLITGETGTGKELFARALFLFSDRTHRSFLSVNCARYTGGDLIASELFGHRKGSFTGAVADHRGVFEEGDGGVLFLDEIGELPLSAQAMLLRALSEGEIVPVGESRARRVDVRILAATSRDLEPMIAAGRFRADLYYRLRYLHVRVPPLRDRGDDWEMIARYYLDRLNAGAGPGKCFAPETVRQLRSHRWPGNVREVRSLVDTGYHMSVGNEISLGDLDEVLQLGDAAAFGEQDARSRVIERCARMASGEESFWDVVHRPFMSRDLNRAEVREIISHGLGTARGSYMRLLEVFGIEHEDYLKFMDFLRHHRLKPSR